MLLSRLLSHEHVLNVITSRKTELVFDFHKKLMRETEGQTNWRVHLVNFLPSSYCKHSSYLEKQDTKSILVVLAKKNDSCSGGLPGGKLAANLKSDSMLILGHFDASFTSAVN